MTRITRNGSLPVLRLAAGFSAAFGLFMCLLVLINFIQIKRTDPLNTPALKVLTSRLDANPADDGLRQQVRELDLVARKAFFTTRWQVRMGGYLIFFSFLAAVISLKAIELQSEKIPEEPVTNRPDFWLVKKLNRAWVAYTGISLVAVSLALAFLTDRDLGQALAVKAGITGSADKEVANETARGENDPGVKVTDSTAGQDTVKEDSASAGVSLEGYPSQQEIAANFTMFRGNGGIGIAGHKTIPVQWDGASGKNIRWKTEVPLPGYNSPVIWNDRIFLAGANENLHEVYCFDLGSGKILWKTKVDKIPGSPARTPSVNKETGLSAPTMTTDGRRAYAIFANGDLIALDFNGNPVWTKNMGVPSNHYGHSSSLAMFQDLLLVQYDQRNGANLIALKASTGETVWKTNRNVKVSWASPAVVYTGKRTEIILAAEPYVASYNPVNGKELWKIDCISGEVGPSVAYANGIVFSVNEYSKVAAVKIGEVPELLWEDNEYLSDIPSPVATGEYLFMATSYGTVVCFDAKTGTKHWVHEYDNPIYASPMLAGGKLYLLDKKGIMHILKADKTYSVVSESRLGEGSVCTPAFTDGMIIIRGDRNLYCIGQP